MTGHQWISLTAKIWGKPERHGSHFRSSVVLSSAMGKWTVQHMVLPSRNTTFFISSMIKLIIIISTYLFSFYIYIMLFLIYRCSSVVSSGYFYLLTKMGTIGSCWWQTLQQGKSKFLTPWGPEHEIHQTMEVANNKFVLTFLNLISTFYSFSSP